jgi:hypothetical protein
MGDSDSSLGWTTLNISDSILKSHGHFIFSYEMIAYDRFKFCRFRFNSADLLFFFPILLILFPSQESQLLARVKGFFFFFNYWKQKINLPAGFELRLQVPVSTFKSDISLRLTATLS